MALYHSLSLFVIVLVVLFVASLVFMALIHRKYQSSNLGSLCQEHARQLRAVRQVTCGWGVRCTGFILLGEPPLRKTSWADSNDRKSDIILAD